MSRIPQAVDGPHRTDRLAVVVALEALGDGDVRLAEAILLGAGEDGQYVERSRCRVCGAGYEWPGLRDSHEIVVHGFDAEAVPHVA